MTTKRFHRTLQSAFPVDHAGSISGPFKSVNTLGHKVVVFVSIILGLILAVHLFATWGM